MNAEEWRLVPSLDGRYAVSSLGRIRREVGDRGHPCTGRILSSYLCNGYPRVNRGLSGGYIHRMVAEAFLPPKPTPQHEINHIDGDRTNPRAENLEWVTHLENVRHAIDVLGRTVGNPKLRAQTHCKRGHSLMDCYVGKNGYRACRVCRHDYQVARRRKPPEVLG